MPAKPATADEVLELLQPWVARHRRPAWRPVLRAGDGPVTASKMSGKPLLLQDEDWPHCASCKRPLQLFFQLNLDRLPKEVGKPFGSGLLQLFYCRGAGERTCESDDGWEPFSTTCKRVRVIQPPPRPRPRKPPEDLRAFEPKIIVGWEKFVDEPKWAEHEELGLDYEYDFKKKTMRVICQKPKFTSSPLDIDDDIATRLSEQCDGGDKLGGWPNWIQNVEYPNCPRCGKPMQFVFQLTGDALPFMFGDMGIGYITQCKRHKSVVAFGWACH